MYTVVLHVYYCCYFVFFLLLAIINEKINFLKNRN